MQSTAMPIPRAQEVEALRAKSSVLPTSHSAMLLVTQPRIVVPGSGLPTL